MSAEDYINLAVGVAFGLAAALWAAYGLLRGFSWASVAWERQRFRWTIIRRRDLWARSGQPMPPSVELALLEAEDWLEETKRKSTKVGG